MSAPTDKNLIIRHCTERAKDLLQMRGNVGREDLEYLVYVVSRMKDDRLAKCIFKLIGWGDDERAELETLMAIGLELMKDSSPSRLREAARKVELRYHLKEVE